MLKIDDLCVLLSFDYSLHPSGEMCGKKDSSGFNDLASDVGNGGWVWKVLPGSNMNTVTYLVAQLKNEYNDLMNTVIFVVVVVLL